jgi:hypothetical protein
MNIFWLLLFLDIFASFCIAGDLFKKHDKNNDDYLVLEKERSNNNGHQITDIKRLRKTAIKLSKTNDKNLVGNIVELYNSSFHLFATADNYIFILDNCPNNIIRQANEFFIAQHLEHFLSLMPNIKNIYKAHIYIKIDDNDTKILKHIMTHANSLKQFVNDLSNFSASSKYWHTSNLLRFIRNNLTDLKALDPDIDDVMYLHQYILYNIPTGITWLEEKVATLIKIKETFANDFSLSDQIRLFGYGCNEPSNVYISQLTALKKSLGLKF